MELTEIHLKKVYLSMKRIKCDLGSAYPKMAIAFCLDPSNYIDHEDMPFHNISEQEIAEEINQGYKVWSNTDWGHHCIENNIIPIPVTFRQSIEELKKIKEYKNCDFEGVTELRGIYYFKQNPNAILCKAFDAPMRWKQELKNKLKATPEDDSKHTVLEQEYDSSKRFGNSGFGISGNKYNRLFKCETFNSITFLVRDLLLSILPKVRAKGWDVIFIDTDSFVLEAEDESVVKILNGWVKDWAMDKYGNNKVDIRFEYEGHFISLYVGGKCRYMGYLQKPNGEIKEEIKGLEIKRKNATQFQKKEQKAFFKYLLDGHTFTEIEAYVIAWIDRIKEAPLNEIGFPRKLSKPREAYGKKEIFFRALDNAKAVWPDFDKEIGEKFYYIYVKDQDVEVLAYDDKKLDAISKDKIDYTMLIEKQIFNILVPVYAGLNWGNELLKLAETYGVQLESSHRNTLLEEYENYEELKKYFSAIETKKRLNPQPPKEKKPKKAKTLTKQD